MRRTCSSAWHSDGAEVLASTPEAYAADIAAEETKWSEIVRKAGIKAE